MLRVDNLTKKHTLKDSDVCKNCKDQSRFKESLEEKIYEINEIILC